MCVDIYRVVNETPVVCRSCTWLCGGIAHRKGQISKLHKLTVRCELVELQFLVHDTGAQLVSGISINYTDRAYLTCF